MNVTIELSDGQAAALKVQAEAQGLTVERWLERSPSNSRRPLPLPTCRRPAPKIGRAGFTSGRRVMTALRHF
jgi:hypothetical protein